MHRAHVLTTCIAQLAIQTNAADDQTRANGISFDHFLTYFLIGAMGAASLELLKLYEYRGRLGNKRTKLLIRSPLFWSVVAGMLGASGFFAWAMYANSESATVWHVAAAGAAIRSLVRQLIGSWEANKKTTLGDDISLSDVFS